MRSISLSFRSIICACCVANVACGDEAVVRISDADSQPGVVRIQDQAAAAEEEPAAEEQAAPVVAPQNFGAIYTLENQPAGIQPVSWSMPTGIIVPVGYSAGCGPTGCTPGCAVPSMPCYDQSGCNQGYAGVYCPSGACDGAYNCDSCQSCQSCDSCHNGSTCNDCYYAPGHHQRVTTLFAKAAPPTGCYDDGHCKRWIRGQQRNYFARNQRLSNHLFGWLIPAGHHGGGSPPFGAYQITYADQPTYSHPQDGTAYGAQGYGVHCKVPLPPTVRQSYNYSWGLPASRLTPVGQPVPGTTPQPLMKQTW